MARSSARRALAVAALLAAVLAVGYLALVASGPTYTLHARFADAGQLVQGDLVEVAGRQVGSISKIALTPTGQADVELSIDDGSVAPLHAGTSATIRQVGLVTITNRYVQIAPGPASAPALPDGGVLTEQHTFGIVDADELLDAMTPATRADVQQILAATARALGAPAAAQFHGALAYLNPALAQTVAFAQQASGDRSALGDLVHSTGSVAAALAASPDQLTSAVHGTADALRQLAAQRTAVADLLQQAPGVLHQADGTLEVTRSTLARLNPFLADLQPVAPKAAALLRQLLPVLTNDAPAVAQLRGLLPQATHALGALPAARAKAAPAIAAGTQALAALQPMLDAFRPYAPDLVAGLFNGFGGANSGYYDANGHFSRIALELGPGGQFGMLTPTPAPAPGGYRTGLTARCPGAASEPAAAGANPWLVPGICDAKQGFP